MKISIVSRSGKGATLIDLDEDAPVRDLKAKYGRLRRVAPERQRFTLPAKAGEARGVALEDGKRLSDYGLKDGDVLQFKDLGPQIGYQTVFLLEYAGPLIIYPLFHFFPGIFYPWASEEQLSRPRDPAQVMAVFYWSFHYVKRLLETVLVHKFGHDTMPLANLFRNCGYYWGFAAWVSYFVNHPLYTPPWEMQTLAAFGLALGCQVANLKCHVILSELRKPGERGYKIPRGFLFDFITCPNYTTEVLGWLLFAVATQTLPALVFAVAGTYQMAVWAIQKHKRLKKIFNGQDGNEKYPFRWIMLPPLF